MSSSLAAPAFVTRGAGVSREGGSSALAALVERAREGDGRAFDRLMLETQERVVGLAWKLLGSREDARDAAQEVYVRVFRSLGRFRLEQDFFGWLYRITVNVCRDAARRRRRFSTVSIREEPAQAAEAEEALLGAERWSLVLAALSSLPPKERAALVLRDLEGWTSEEAARILGSRPGTVRAQIASARSRIRRFCADLMKAKAGERS